MCALLGLMRVFAVVWTYRGGRDEGWAMMNDCGWVNGLGWGVGLRVGVGVGWVGWGVSDVGVV